MFFKPRSVSRIRRGFGRTFTSLAYSPRNITAPPRANQGRGKPSSLVLRTSREMCSPRWNAPSLYANLQKQMSSRRRCWPPDVHLQHPGFSEHPEKKRKKRPARDGDGLQRRRGRSRGAGPLPGTARSPRLKRRRSNAKPEDKPCKTRFRHAGNAVASLPTRRHAHLVVTATPL